MQKIEDLEVFTRDEINNQRSVDSAEATLAEILRSLGSATIKPHKYEMQYEREVNF
jgi:hypothetical protein